MKENPKSKGKKGNVMPNSANYGSNYAVFQWTGTAWVVYANHCDYGCCPLPPSVPGDYVGQLSTTSCVPLA